MKWNRCSWVFLLLVLFLTGCTTTTLFTGKDSRKPSEAPLIIRVLVDKEAQTYVFDIKDGFIEHQGGRALLPEHNRVDLYDTHVILNGADLQTPVTITGSAPILLNGHPYKGAIRIEKGFIVNELPIEEYLKGVLSSEMSEKWPLEALKAQAVASRTYAYIKSIQNRNQPFDLESTETHQKYEYVEETAQIQLAVAKTRSLIILHKGEPVEVFFHASSGGVTESCGDVFQVDLPYLRSFPDPYSRTHQGVLWTVKKSGQEIKSAVKGMLGEGFEALTIRDITPASRTGSGRVKEFVLLFDENRQATVSGNLFRLALDARLFRSLLILEIQKEMGEGDVVFTFTGLGYGHGVGLSQWGARNMALQGFSFEHIISYYFKGTEISDYHFFPSAEKS